MAIRRTILYPLVAAGFLPFAAAWGADAVPDMPAMKPGLWEVKMNNNAASIFPPSHSAAEAARRSQESLNGSGMVYQQCFATEQQPQLAMLVRPGGCEPVGTAMPARDLECKGGKVHLEYVRDPSSHRLTGITATQSVPHIQGGIVIVELSFDSPEHYFVRTTAPGVTDNGVALLWKADAHWVSGDCGDVPPGSLRTPDGKIVAQPKP
jgi:hypothetical protein